MRQPIYKPKNPWLGGVQRGLGALSAYLRQKADEQRQDEVWERQNKRDDEVYERKRDDDLDLWKVLNRGKLRQAEYDREHQAEIEKRGTFEGAVPGSLDEATLDEAILKALFQGGTPDLQTLIELKEMLSGKNKNQFGTPQTYGEHLSGMDAAVGDIQDEARKSGRADYEMEDPDDISLDEYLAQQTPPNIRGEITNRILGAGEESGGAYTADMANEAYRRHGRENIDPRFQRLMKPDPNMEGAVPLVLSGTPEGQEVGSRMIDPRFQHLMKPDPNPVARNTGGATTPNAALRQKAEAMVESAPGSESASPERREALIQSVMRKLSQ